MHCCRVLVFYSFFQMRNPLIGNSLRKCDKFKSIIDGMKFKQITLNGSLTGDISSRLDSLFLKYINLLAKTKQYISNSTQPDWTSFRDYRSLTECARIMPGHLRLAFRVSCCINFCALPMACTCGGVACYAFCSLCHALSTIGYSPRSLGLSL